jgi:hypothetical protein
VDVDTEFFEALPTDDLVRRLASVDMPADEVPAVWIPPTQWMAMHHEHEAVAHKCGDCDRNLGDHDGRLSIKCTFGVCQCVRAIPAENTHSHSR